MAANAQSLGLPIRRDRNFQRAALFAGIAAGLTIVTSATGATTPPATGAQWTQAGGTPQGTQFSSLTDITASNAGGLVEEFSYPTGAKGSHQGSPLVVGSVMYVVTPFPEKLIALDLTHPGTALWTFSPEPGRVCARPNLL